MTDRPLSWFRQKFIDKYEGIRKVVEKARELRGDDSYLLAGMDALKAAYLSDKTKGVAQEAITSGQLIYRDGITVVDTEKKGLVEILQPLFDIDQDDCQQGRTIRERRSNGSNVCTRKADGI